MDREHVVCITSNDTKPFESDDHNLGRLDANLVASDLIVGIGFHHQRIGPISIDGDQKRCARTFQRVEIEAQSIITRRPINEHPSAGG